MIAACIYTHQRLSVVSSTSTFNGSGNVTFCGPVYSIDA